MRIVFVFLLIVAIISGFSQNSEVVVDVVPTRAVAGMKLIGFTSIKAITDENVFDAAKTIAADQSIKTDKEYIQINLNPKPMTTKVLSPDIFTADRFVMEENLY